jgi:hypothetical protein
MTCMGTWACDYSGWKRPWTSPQLSIRFSERRLKESGGLEVLKGKVGPGKAKSHCMGMGRLVFSVAGVEAPE